MKYNLTPYKIIGTFFTIALLFVSCEESGQENERKKEITFWGDSMTAGALGEGITISKTVSEQLKRQTYNFGVGGLSSNSIAVLQGGVSLTLKIENNSIPSSGEANITEYNILPFNNQTSQKRIGYLSDIKGELVRINNTDSFIFRRLIDGNSTTVTNEVPFLFEDAIHHTKDITVIWSGRNDPKVDSQLPIIKSNILSMVNFLSHRKFIVISICNGDLANEGVGTPIHSNIIALNNSLHQTFGNNFLDLRKYMVEQAIYDSGITPSSQDIIDMNADCIPTSLRADGVHFNSKGYELAGKCIARYIEARGW